jgi:hypothetical protein
MPGNTVEEKRNETGKRGGKKGDIIVTVTSVANCRSFSLAK